MTQMRELAWQDCLGILAKGDIGRVALSTPLGPRIVPVSYTLDGEDILFRTTPYSELGTYGRDCEVAFEVDHIDSENHSGCVAVAVGRVETIDDGDDEPRWRQPELDPASWAEGQRHLYMRLRIRDLTGRLLPAERITRPDGIPAQVKPIRNPNRSRAVGTAARPLLGVRRQPGRLALAVFRLPLPLYRAGWGWLLGHTFLLLVHVGRKTGQPHSIAAMVLKYDGASGEAVICSAWGPNADWIRNLRARPALRVQIGRRSFTPEHRFLSEEESFAVATDFRSRHPLRLRFISWVLGWGDLRSDAAVRELIRTRPFVALRPASDTRGAAAGHVVVPHEGPTA